MYVRGTICRTPLSTKPEILDIYACYEAMCSERRDMRFLDSSLHIHVILISLPQDPVQDLEFKLKPMLFPKEVLI